MKKIAPQIYAVVLRLVLGLCALTAFPLYAGPTDPVTIHVTIRYTLPAYIVMYLETPLTATGTLTLEPGPPVRTTLQYDWDSSTKKGVPELEKLLSESRADLEPEDISKIETFLRKFHASNRKHHREEISVKQFEKLRRLYGETGSWEITVAKPGGDITLPTRLAKQVPLELLADAGEGYTPLVPVREAYYESGRRDRPAVKEDVFHRALEDLNPLTRPVTGVELLFFPNPLESRAIPVFYLGKDVWGDSVVISVKDWAEFREGRLAAISTYSVDRRTLAFPLSEIPIEIYGNPGFTLAPWKTGDIERNSVNATRNSLLSTLEEKVLESPAISQ